MSIQLKLDANAMASLFPEGSEVRLELQQTVIGEVVRRLVDKYTTTLRAEVDGHIRKISDEARKAFSDELERQGIGRDWSKLTLSKESKALIAEAAREAYRSEVSAAIAQVEKPAIESMERQLKSNLDNGLRFRLDAMAKEALRGALK